MTELFSFSPRCSMASSATPSSSRMFSSPVMKFSECFFLESFDLFRAGGVKGGGMDADEDNAGGADAGGADADEADAGGADADEANTGGADAGGADAGGADESSLETSAKGEAVK